MTEKTSEKVWTTEMKEQVVSTYLAAEPTPENTGDIVAGIATKLGKSPNGIRRILVLAQVYITKTPTRTESTTTRISKADCMVDLLNVLEANQLKVDNTILDKMTGKAMIYWTEVLTVATGD